MAISKFKIPVMALLIMGTFTSTVFAKRISNTLVGTFNVLTPTPSIVYVSSIGNDLNTGASPEEAMLTINDAIKKVETGGTVQVLGGTYSQSVNIDKSIILKGDAENVPKLQGDPSTNGSVITINPSVNDVSIIGVEIYGKANSATSLYGIAASGSDTSRINIKNNYIHDVSKSAILANSGTGHKHEQWVIDNNKIEHCGNNSIEIQNASDIEIANNIIYGGYSNIKLTFSADCISQNLSVFRNTLTRTADDGVTASITCQGTLSSVVNNMNISKNDISSNVGSGKALLLSSGITSASCNINFNDNIVTTSAASISTIIDSRNANVDATRNYWINKTKTIDLSPTIRVSTFPFALDGERNSDGTLKNLKQSIALTWDNGTFGSKGFIVERGSSKGITI